MKSNLTVPIIIVYGLLVILLIVKFSGSNEPEIQAQVEKPQSSFKVDPLVLEKEIDPPSRPINIPDRFRPDPEDNDPEQEDPAIADNTTPESPEGDDSNKPDDPSDPGDLTNTGDAIIRLLAKDYDQDAARETADKFLNAAIETGEWAAYRDLQLRSMEKALTDNKIDPNHVYKLNNEELFLQALLRWKLLEIYTPETGFKRADTTMPRWIFGNTKVMEEILLTIREKDNAKDVFKLLPKLWESHGDVDQAKKYFSLALATAVVFDRKVRYTTPPKDDEYSIDPLVRYKWYVEKNEAGALESGIHQESARNLVFVVCAPISESELDWALNKYHDKTRRTWSSTYNEISLIDRRDRKGDGPYKKYTLEEIHEKGGLSGDQAYYAVNTARAVGIPAFTLRGYTNRGKHDWAAIKVSGTSWDTGIGRVNDASSGMGRDPQTRGTISEQDAKLWSTDLYQNRNLHVQINSLLWLSEAMDEADMPDYSKVPKQLAHKAGKSFPYLWERLYELLEKDPRYIENPKQAVSLWKKFHQAVKNEFKLNPRMSALCGEIEDKYIFPYDDIYNIRRILAAERNANFRESVVEVESIIESLKREAEILLKREPASALREIEKLYDGALVDYGNSISAFEQMSEDYFTLMKTDEHLVKRAVKDIEEAYEKVIAVAGIDWSKADSEVELHKRICEMYEEIGEEERADFIERIMEKRIERDQEDQEKKSDK